MLAHDLNHACRDMACSRHAQEAYAHSHELGEHWIM